MPRPRRKTPDELMQEAIWNLGDICRVFRKGPKTILWYINHPDPKRRLPAMMVNGEFCAERQQVLDFFRYQPGDDLDINSDDEDYRPTLRVEENRI